MAELEVSGVLEAAARARINERCASAYLHDIRGSMQALFGALELLSKSAKLSTDNPARVEKIADMARRAIAHHEKSTLSVLQLLTLQQELPTSVQMGVLVGEVAHFLRNDATSRRITVKTTVIGDGCVLVERARFQTLLTGLLTACLDTTSEGGHCDVAVDRSTDEIRVALHSSSESEARTKATLVSAMALVDRQNGSDANFPNLTLDFASAYLAARGGVLELSRDPPYVDLIELTLPLLPQS